MIVQVLLVFARDDRQLEVLRFACESLGWSVLIARNAEETLDLCQSHCHDVVVVDRREQQCQLADDTCRLKILFIYFHNKIYLA